MLVVALADEAATLDLGRALAEAAGPLTPPPALLLTGSLGSGKTTLVRGLVAALPGGEAARVSSPSFNLMNLYPTRPEVAHFDLYRLEDGNVGDDLLDCLHEAGGLKVVEWAERLPPDCRPEDLLTVELRSTGAGREAAFAADGGQARACLRKLRARLGPGTPTGARPLPVPLPEREAH